VSIATDIVALSLAGGSLAVSGWAAWTAHQAREWQRKRDEERRATRVRLEFVHGTGPLNVPFVLLGGGSPMPEPPTVYTVSLAVVNDGEATEYVTAAFFVQATGNPASMIRVYGSEGGIDVAGSYELRPRATLHVPVELESQQVEWMREGFIADVWLGSGAHVKSDVERLDPVLLDQLT
jgi:hypothetical protein